METCRFICIYERGGKRFYAPGKALEPAKRGRLYLGGLKMFIKKEPRDSLRTVKREDLDNALSSYHFYEP